MVSNTGRLRSDSLLIRLHRVKPGRHCCEVGSGDSLGYRFCLQADPLAEETF